MTMSDKEEAERRYPAPRTDITDVQRAAYIAGREDERAALATAKPAADALEKLAWRFQSIMGDHLTVDPSDNEIMGTGAASYAMARAAADAIADLRRQLDEAQRAGELAGEEIVGLTTALRLAERALASQQDKP